MSTQTDSKAIDADQPDISDLKDMPEKVDTDRADPFKVIVDGKVHTLDDDGNVTDSN